MTYSQDNQQIKEEIPEENKKNLYGAWIYSIHTEKFAEVFNNMLSDCQFLYGFGNNKELIILCCVGISNPKAYPAEIEKENFFVDYLDGVAWVENKITMDITWGVRQEFMKKNDSFINPDSAIRTLRQVGRVMVKGCSFKSIFELAKREFEFFACELEVINEKIENYFVVSHKMNYIEIRKLIENEIKKE